MRSWVLTVLLVALGTCACQRSNRPSDQSDIEKERLANNVIRKVATHLKQETELRPCGTMGQMLNEVQVLGLSFYYYKPIDIVEGRKLLLKAMNELMEEVNRETRIHPYLSRYPFTARNVFVEIFVRSPEGRDVSPGAFWIIKASEGMLCYKIHHPTKIGLITVYKETYDEALQRLADPSLPLVPFQPDPEISQEELARLRKGVSFVSVDGSIWHLGEDGCWEKDEK